MASKTLKTFKYAVLSIVILSNQHSTDARTRTVQMNQKFNLVNFGREGIMSKKPVVVIVTFHIKKGMEEAFKQELINVLEPVLAESECINLNMYQNVDDPTHFMLYETWTSKDYFINVQLKKPYYKPYLAKTKQMWESPRKFTYWEMFSENVGSGGSLLNLNHQGDHKNELVFAKESVK